jgi:hypothetical protein
MHGKYDELQAKFLSETPKERDHFGHVSADGRILQKSILSKYDMKMWIEFIWQVTANTIRFHKKEGNLTS